MASGHHCYSKQFKKRHKQKSNIASTRRQGGVRSIILERGHLAPHSASPAQKKKREHLQNNMDTKILLRNVPYEDKNRQAATSALKAEYICGL